LSGTNKQKSLGARSERL